MKVSIVTISFNQGEYLERAITSVLEQDYDDIEYIVVDPGSTDGSREIINKYSSRISKIILSPDDGPSDGLNKGFADATGEVYAFLNADDVLLPGAVSQAVECLKLNNSVDAVYGNSLITDENDQVLRKAYSDIFSLYMRAYGKCTIMQPSTFFMATAFKAVGGFNSENRSNWDGELFTDMALVGARFMKVPFFWSCYRIQPQSITGTGKLDQQIQKHYRKMFEKIMHRKPIYIDTLIGIAFKFLRYLLNPNDLFERVLHGPIYRRGVY
jgi:glycosyltransferase involved in cell wall biosynthesis